MRRAVFLDKDGVINVDRGHVCTPQRTDFIDGIFDLCRTANRQGWLVVVVTNQAVIGRGRCSEAEFLEYMDWVRSKFTTNSAQLNSIYYCPHHPFRGHGVYKMDCECRKPAPGMLLAAQREWDLDMRSSLLLGDRDSDVKAGLAAGVGTRLVVRTVMDGCAGRTAFTRDFMRQVEGILSSQPVAARQCG